MKIWVIILGNRQNNLGPRVRPWVLAFARVYQISTFKVCISSVATAVDEFMKHLSKRDLSLFIIILLLT